MKVIFCRWNSICERGMTRALNQLGHEIIPFDRRFTTVDYDKQYLALLAQIIICNKDADCVLSVNYMPIIARVCKNFNIRYVSWISDSPCFQLYSETLGYDTNRVFLFDRMQYLKFRQYNPDNIFYFPLGCDIDYWENVNVTNEDKKNYSCDVSFVGSLYSEKSKYASSVNDLSEYTHGYMEGIIEAQSKVYGYYFIDDVLTDEMANRFKKEVGWNQLASDYIEDVKGIVSETYLGMHCTSVERHRIIQAIADNYNIDLWTQSDTSMLRNVNVRGGADSESMMPKIIKCSKININHTNRPIKTGLPLRIFDIMGCGGFLISNYQEEIPELFLPDKEIVLFDSIPDLIDKIGYYLKHEDERLAIAKAGFERIKKDYSYTSRLAEMLEMI